jgi:alpha-tubulin suppressor-like RCC1 family protein
MPKRFRTAGLALLTFVVLSCGEDGTGVVTPAGLVVVSGDAQTGTVAQPLAQPITLRVVDADDTPIDGVEITLVAEQGTLAPATATTDADGTASITWTLGTTAGRQGALASVDALTADFSATAEAAAAATLTMAPLAPDTVFALAALGATVQLSADAADAYGNPVTALSWSSTADSVATVASDGRVTAAGNGEAGIVASAGTAADTAIVMVDQVATAVNVTGATSRLGWSETVQLAAAAVDANGHPVPAVPVSWASADTGVAAVDTTGRVVGVGLGAVDIRATADTVTGRFPVTVTPVRHAAMTVNASGGCLLSDAGAAYCWGYNNQGELGDGTNEFSSAPVAVAGGHRFVYLGQAQGHHYCGLEADGAAYCWGANDFGQLGDGTITDQNVPVATGGGVAFRAIGTGAVHTCGMGSNGVVYCWGGNAFGQLGDATTMQRATPTPVAISLPLHGLSVGANHSCALHGTQAYCWGSNWDGQIGDGTSASPRTTPTPVVGGHAVSSLAAGGTHTCAVTEAGAPYCWGQNQYGELGDGTTIDATSPTAVRQLTAVDRVAVGDQVSCAVTSGTAYCWGRNGQQNLGDGTLVDRSTPVEVLGGHSWRQVQPNLGHTCGITEEGTAYCWGLWNFAGAGFSPDRTTPTTVLGDHAFAFVGAGHLATCAITDAAEGYCWGTNQKGDLGIDDPATSHITTPVAMAAPTLETVSMGYDFGCGLTADGTAYCWGENLSGELGTGTSGDTAYAPVAVDAAFAFSDISAGENHACGIRASNGAAYCWGNNGSSQLGDGTTVTRLSPQLVYGGHTFTKIAAGDFHTCALENTGAIYCWGAGAEGRLGDGTTTDRTAPTAVAGGLTFAAVNAGGYHSCGLTTDSLAYCWGANGAGQLGDGTETNRSTPTAVGGGLHFAELDAGTLHSCGVATSGHAYCWGSNSYGKLGNGGTSSQNAPTPVAGGHIMATVSSGAGHTCATTPDGDAYCWGYVARGQLGDGSSIFLDPTPVAVPFGGW